MSDTGGKPRSAFSKTAGRSWVLNALVAVSALLAIASIALPNYMAAIEREGPYRRSCYAMQKAIVGASEMYSLDRSRKPRTAFDIQFFREMRSGGYLPEMTDVSASSDFTHSRPYWDTFRITNTGNGIYCVDHGSIQ